MSIASALVAAQGKVANCYTTISNKGGTLPATQDLSNMPTAINSIPSGSTPTGTISITTNGTYNVTNYATADVNVSGGTQTASNFYVTGSLTITNTTATAFSANNYINLPVTLDGDNNYWEIGLSFSLGSGSSYMPIISSSTESVVNGYTNSYTDIGIYAVRGSPLKLWLGDGDTWSIAEGATGVTSLASTETRYYLKLVFNGSSYVLSLSTDGSTWTTEITVNSSTKMGSAVQPKFYLGKSGFGSSYGTEYLDGTIYFDGCYINADGNELWTPFQTPVSIDTPKEVPTGQTRPTLGTPTSDFSIVYPAYIGQINSYGLYYAFARNSNLKSVTIPAIVCDTYGLYYAFMNCVGLETLKLPRMGRLYDYALSYMCNNCSGLKNVDLGKASPGTLSSSYSNYCFQYAFRLCTSLESISIKIPTTIYGKGVFYGTFYGCSSLKTVNLQLDLTRIDVTGQSGMQSMFYDCPSLTSLPIAPYLRQVTAQSGFASGAGLCTGLTSVNFEKLTTLSGSACFQQAFSSCSSLTELRFPALTTFGSYTNQFNNMLYGCSNVTVHFKSSVQSTIGSWSSVTGGFGGTNTTVLFDL